MAFSPVKSVTSQLVSLNMSDQIAGEDRAVIEPDVSTAPSLDLDQLLAQLVDRARDVMATRDRLRALLKANRVIVGDLALPVVLRRIVEAACELVSAKYGALGVIGPAGGLEQFIHVGIDDATVARIGPLPEGKGLLGALITDPHPIRLHNIADDPRSVGFPPEHPQMTSFIGVPIRVRDEIFGNLYLSESSSGEFSAEDEELVSALAASAGVAIENARLYGESRRRQDWLQASTDVTRVLLSMEGEEPLQLIARKIRELGDADVVTVVLPTPDGERLMVEVATGVGADQLVGITYDAQNTLGDLAIATGRPVLIGDASENPQYMIHLSQVAPIGPVMVLPLVASQGVRGALAVGRLHGRHRFSESDMDIATTFANHAAVALELADARAHQQRMALLEDRDRIARDLHDHVIQRLFAAGLSAQSVASGLGGSVHAERLARIVGDLDETISQIRTSIFQLRGPLVPDSSSARGDLLSVADEISELLGFTPQVRFEGPIDSIVLPSILDELIAVLREALTNVARHAQATEAIVTLAVDDKDLVLEVSDDGTGIGAAERRSGLANLQSRAENRGGSLTLSPPEIEGTRLTWKIPLE